jgi:hypothetical protein
MNPVISKLTSGWIITRSRYQELLCQPDRSELKNLSAYYLVVYSINPQFTRITCYPISTTSIIKITLEVQDDLPITTPFLVKAFKSFEIIHTTGISKIKTIYLAEFYLACPFSVEEINQLKSTLLNHKEILQCSIESISQL